MTDYLNSSFDWSNPSLVSAFDEAPLWSARFGSFLLEHIHFQRGMRLLDLACGTGFPLLDLGQSLGDACLSVGLDTWLPALERARQKLQAFQIEYISLIGGDGIRIPFASGVLDLITSNLGINNFDSPLDVFHECGRVLKTGGHIALTTNPVGHMAEFYSTYEAVLIDLGLDEFIQELHLQAAHRMGLEKITSLLSGAGFEVCAVDQTEFHLRYLDGKSFFQHRFIQEAFLEGWRSVIPQADEARVFNFIEGKLNDTARKNNGLSFTVPILFIDAIKK